MKCLIVDASNGRQWSIPTPDATFLRENTVTRTVMHHLAIADWESSLDKGGDGLGENNDIKIICDAEWRQKMPIEEDCYPEARIARTPIDLTT